MKFAEKFDACFLNELVNTMAKGWTTFSKPDLTQSKLIAILPAGIPSGSYDLVLTTKPNGKPLRPENPHWILQDDWNREP